ncbi:phage major tail protein, TP901-1 family [Rhizobium sp. Rhizsp82]|uniref:phage major tail protein, TP901-1 family n=1 Tax=Rhizobium sp. Rhizsp82 TaxID=3243057 RepID=UPI0039B642E1
MPQKKGRTLLIQIGNGADPEVFAALCGLTTRSFNLSTNSVDTTIPDCNNPDATPQRTTEPGINSRTFSGSGAFVSSANTTAFMTHVIESTTFNAKVIVPGLGTFTGTFFVTDFELSGETEGNMQFSATFEAASVLAFEAED